MNSFYSSPTKNIWTGRKEALPLCYVHEDILVYDLNNPPAHVEGNLALLGFAVEEGVLRNGGRPGASEGPQSFRKSLSKMPLPREISTPIYDAGDIVCPKGDLEGARYALSKAVQTLHLRGLRPLLMGGGHEIAFAHYLGLFHAYPKAKIGILQIDAHFDMRPLQNGRGTSGTSFGEIADHASTHQLQFDHLVLGIQPFANNRLLFSRAEKEKTQFVTASKIAEAPEIIEKMIERSDIVYVSFCLDVIAAPFAPGVSAPQSLGLLPREVQQILEIVFQSPKTVAFDMAELSPPHDINSVTAHLSASFAMLWFQAVQKKLLGV